MTTPNSQITLSFNKCGLHTSSQYAYLCEGNERPKSIRIDEYIEQKHNLTCQNIFCLKGHELVCANGKKNKPHFRHKNAGDMDTNPMSEWHIEWQGNFPVTEIEFVKNCDQQIKNRRTDILLNETHVIEIQHSKITKEEVNNRKNDYNLHNKTIIWVIDGNEGILVNELPKSGRVYLEFTTNLWKFESFMDYDFIYIDIGCEIYKIYPKLIKSNMIDVHSPVGKSHFIDCLLNNVELFTDAHPLQCKLFIKQQGAGNGKTHGIIKMLESDEFAHYKYFIFVSKQHSAVHVIYKEFQQQIENGNLSHIKLDGESKFVNKKHIIQFYNLKTSKICQMIIGTVDSFMYSIGNKNHTEIDKFEGLVNSIIDDHIETTTQCGRINYGGIKPKLFKETILIGDEEQDLKISYAKAIIQIMRNRYIDVYIVGDKLQSINYEVNAFTYLLENEFPYIDKITYEFTNVCRRFNHPKLIHFVNSMIPFEKYGLPEIELVSQTVDACLNTPLTIFAGNKIYPTTSGNVINAEVDAIMKHYEREVLELGRLPEDFLIVTPFTRSNPLVDALQLAIDIYWKNRDVHDDEYKRYAVFHKSEDGSSINLNESEKATRMVSIHSSKGDGRKVVFVIGLNESGLCKFGGKSDSLIYDSLFHVAVTRMKEKLYIRCEGDDDISVKMQKYLQETDLGEHTNIKPNIQIYDDIKLKNVKDNVKDNCKTTDNFQLFKVSLFDLMDLQILCSGDDTDDKQLIDTSHHDVRFASMRCNLLLQIVKKEEEKKREFDGNSDPTIKKQIKAIFHCIIETGINEVSNWKDFNVLLSKNTDEPKKGETKSHYIPILKMMNNGRDYVKYYNIIVAFAKDILVKLKSVVDGNNVHNFCPIECIVLHYMIESVVQGKYTGFNISELYNIVDIYSKSFIQNSFRGEHCHCICNKCFTSGEWATPSTCKINNSLESYICVHFEKMNKFSSNYLQFCASYPNISWQLNCSVYFNGETSDFKLHHRYDLIGYDSDCIIIAYIKPQFNSLNYNQILMDSVFDAFLFKHVQRNYGDEISHNYKKFSGKKIRCVVFTTDLEEPYYINITDELLEQNETVIRSIIKESVLTKYLLDSKMIYNFYKYWRKKCLPEITGPLEIIDYIVQKFKKEKEEKEKNRSFPDYILEFFNNIKFKIESCRNKQEQTRILREYDKKEKFIEHLDQRLSESVNRYFGTHVSDLSEDDICEDTGFQSD